MLTVFSVLTLILSSVYTLYFLRRAVSRREKREAGGGSRNLDTKGAGRGVGQARDLSLWESVNFGWEAKACMWDDIPGYQRLRDAIERYGKVVRGYYFSPKTKSVFVGDLKLAKQIFASSTWLLRLPNDHYTYLPSFKKPLGILLGNGQHWKKSRLVVLSALRQHGLLDQAYLEELYLPEIQPLVAQLQERIERSDRGDHLLFSPQHLFDLPVMNVVFKFLMGRPLSEVERKPGSGLPYLVDKTNKSFTAYLSAIEYFPFLRYFPQLTFLGPVMKLCDTIYDIVEKETAKRRKLGRYLEEQNDVLDSFLKELDENQAKSPNYFTFETLKVNVRDLIIAAGDTTSMVLQHLILHMALNPQIQRKVQAEIDEVIGSERWPSYDDKARMIYTQAVILETLRFGSIVPATSRRCDRDTKVWDLSVTKGTWVFISYFGIHHSKEIWGDPEVFRPERFLSEDNEIVNEDKMLPFSYGPRACIGEVGARVALFLFTVSLLRDFAWEISDEHPPPAVTKNIKGLSRAPAPYWVKLRRRIAG